MPLEQQQPGFGDKIQDILNQIISTIVALFSSLHTKEIKLNSRILVVERQLGEGGFSFVYLVRDKKDGSKYALKRINTQLEEQAELLKTEIEAHKAVNSPHVLKLIDSRILNINGRVSEGLLLLPFYNKGTVQDLIEKNEEISLKDICSISRDICKGLEAFHNAVPSLSFRDLKPANVLINDNNRAVLMDLG
jgi:serine/threonine kinase 16